MNYDIIIIGGGPGGYVAGIRASQLGKKVAIVESTHLGGVCLNWGCIPTKALLQNAHILENIKEAKKFGVTIPEYSVDWKKGIKRSRNVSKRLNKGIEYLLKKNNIDYIPAKGKLLNKNTVETEDKNGKTNQITSKYIIIATGARSKYFPGMEPDGNHIITSKEAIVLDEQPKSIIIIGAGAIGVEFAHFFNSYGTHVIIIESLPQILPVEDEDISKELASIMKKKKIDIRLNTLVKNISKDKSGVKIETKDGEIVKAEKAMIAVGVQGNIEDIGLEDCNIKIENGWIKTDGYMKTTTDNIYAIGDVAGPPWLAHVASAEGIVAVENICGLEPQAMKYDNIPVCTYCTPEVASVGLTEKQAIDQGFEIKIGKFPFRALGKSLATAKTDGFTKIIYEAKYGEMLGCHIIGSEATNLISEAVIARTLETTHLDVLHCIHPHPTLSEAILEATADALDEAIHI